MSKFNLEEIRKLKSYLESILKTEKPNIEKIEYVDFDKNKEKLLGPQRIVVYGRKGAGKTILLRQVEKINKKEDIFPLYIDCKDYKGHTYPDLLIKILLLLFKKLKSSQKNIFKKIYSKILFDEEIKKLKEILNNPDYVKKEINKETSADVKADLSCKAPLINTGTSGKISEKEIQKFEITEEKIYLIEKELKNYKERLERWINKSHFKEIYILIDEYYYLNLVDQPIIIDYLYRLFFNLPFWLKIATNKYRSKLEEREKSGNSYGITEGEEYTSINLDFTLENLDSAEKFLLEILKNSLKKEGINSEVEEWFSDKAFKRLVWASGGVPRDFIGLLIKILQEIKEETKGINVRMVNSSAQKYFDEKISNDSTEYEQTNLTKELWEKIYDYCIKITKKTAFLIEVSQNSLDKRKNFLDLIDARKIHLVGKNITHKQQPGKRYNAYILNVGCYSKF